MIEANSPFERVLLRGMMVSRMTRPVKHKQTIINGDSGNLKNFSLWTLECPHNLNVADADDEVGDGGADDKDHLDFNIECTKQKESI